jgi:hypothetical protein
MSGVGYRVLNDTRKERTVRMRGVDMPAFYGNGFRVGGDLINVTEPEVYRSRMVEQMEKVEATSKHFRVVPREINPFQGRPHELGGRRPLHDGSDLTSSRTNVSFSRLVDSAFSPTSSDEMAVSRAEDASPCRLVLVFKKMTEKEITEEETQTDKAAPKLQDFWPYTGPRDVVGGRSEYELRDAYNADRGTDHSQPDGRFYFVWGKMKRDKEAGEITVALRHGFGIFVECVPPIEAYEFLPTSFGRKRRKPQFFNPNPAARAKEETRGTGAKIESISARLNSGLFRVTALMTEEQLRECEAGELIEKFNRVLKVGRYRKQR